MSNREGRPAVPAVVGLNGLEGGDDLVHGVEREKTLAVGNTVPNPVS
jgi:hypothetical protein